MAAGGSRHGEQTRGDEPVRALQARQLMAARVTEGWTFRGLEALVLENAALRVTVLPELGGHILDLVDKSLDRNLLWVNPRTAPRRAPYGAHFDDWWSGGWDEIFPTGDRALLHGELLPYMGEAWSVPWRSRIGQQDGSAWVETIGQATIAPARLERTLRLDGDAPVLHIGYRITNLDIRPLPFLWGIHPAFAVGEGHRIDHPATRMLVGESSGPTMGQAGATYDWPSQPIPGSPGVVRDPRAVLPITAGVYGGHWATDLADGWLALTDTASRRGVALSFPREVFPHAWLWQVYGGWRGHHLVCLEPWTGYPMQLEDAARAGRARVLEPGSSLEADVAVILFEGLDHVSGVDLDGADVTVR